MRSQVNGLGNACREGHGDRWLAFVSILRI